MRLDETIVDDVAVVSLKGELWDEEDNRLFQGKISDLQVDGLRKIVVNLWNVTGINSRGLSMLISAFKTMQRVGGDIRFAELNDRMMDLFVTTRLVQALPTYETVGRALASFRVRPT